MSRSPAGIRLRVLFTGLAANAVRWCIPWLKNCLSIQLLQIHQHGLVRLRQGTRRGSEARASEQRVMHSPIAPLIRQHLENPRRFSLHQLRYDLTRDRLDPPFALA